jgi:hypothetical protein
MSYFLQLLINNNTVTDGGYGMRMRIFPGTGRFAKIYLFAM